MKMLPSGKQIDESYFQGSSSEQKRQTWTSQYRASDCKEEVA